MADGQHNNQEDGEPFVPRMSVVGTPVKIVQQW